MSLMLLVSPATRLVDPASKATALPSGEIVGFEQPELPTAPWAPVARSTSTVVPVTRSRR